MITEQIHSLVVLGALFFMATAVVFLGLMCAAEIRRRSRAEKDRRDQARLTSFQLRASNMPELAGMMEAYAAGDLRRISRWISQVTLQAAAHAPISHTSFLSINGVRVPEDSPVEIRTPRDLLASPFFSYGGTLGTTAAEAATTTLVQPAPPAFQCTLSPPDAETDPPVRPIIIPRTRHDDLPNSCSTTS